MVLSSLVFKEILKNGTRGHGRLFATAKRKNKSRFDSFSVRNSVLIISAYYLSGLSRAQSLELAVSP